MIPCRVLGPGEWRPVIVDGSEPLTELPRGQDRLVDLPGPRTLRPDHPREEIPVGTGRLPRLALASGSR